MGNEIMEFDNTLKKIFSNMLSQIEQQTATSTAILALKKLLKEKGDIKPDYYQELITRLCRLLNKIEFDSEELYYRFIIRYYFDSILKIDSSIFCQSIITDLYSKILLDLKANSNKPNIIILCNDLFLYQPFIDHIKSAGRQQINFFQNLDCLLHISDRFIENYDILLVCDDKKNGENAIAILEECRKNFG